MTALTAGGGYHSDRQAQQPFCCGTWIGTKSGSLRSTWIMLLQSQLLQESLPLPKSRCHPLQPDRSDPRVHQAPEAVACAGPHAKHQVFPLTLFPLDVTRLHSHGSSTTTETSAFSLSDLLRRHPNKLCGTSMRSYILLRVLDCLHHEQDPRGGRALNPMYGRGLCPRGTR